MSNSDLPPGLVWRGGLIHICTTVAGRRISRSSRSASVPEAKRMLDVLRGLVRMAELTGTEAPVFHQHVSLGSFVAEQLALMRVDGLSDKTLAKYTGVMTFFGAFLQRRLAEIREGHQKIHESQGRILKEAQRASNIAEQLSITNDLMARIQALSPEAFVGEATVPAPGEWLHGVGSAIRPIPPRPQTPLSGSTLLTGSPDEPALGQELAAELASCDAVDLIVSFIKWHGLRLPRSPYASAR